MKSIGFLSSTSDDRSFKEHLGAFSAGLKKSGYVDGENVKVIFKWARGDFASLRKLADELVDAKVDVIATTGGAVAALAAVKATQKIPVLFISGVDPGKAGLLKSRNATGVDVFSTASQPERLSRLQQLVPGVKKVAVLLRPGTFVYEEEKKVAKKAGLMVVEACDEGEIGVAFATAKKNGAGGIIICANPYFTSQYTKVTKIAKESGLPNAYVWRQFPEDGGLMSFGPILSDAYTTIGEYSGAILNGSSPASLPVKTFGVSDFKLVINDTASKRLKLTIPKTWRGIAEII